MNILILISLIACIEGRKLFHEELSTEDVKHYFGTTSKQEIPAYEFISPKQISILQDKDGTKDLHRQYLLQAFKDDYHLKLKKNLHLMSPGCILREIGDNGTEIIRPCPYHELDCHYHGHSANHSNSWAAISNCNGVHGIVSVVDHDLIIQPVREAHGHLVQTDGLTDTQPHLVYKQQKYNRKCPTTVPTGNSSETEESLTQKSRNRRAAGRKYIEIEVVIAPDSYAFHKQDSTRFATAALNVAAQRFLDPSLGQELYMSLVHLTILKIDQSDLTITNNAGVLLRDFCQWQAGHLPGDESNPAHADVVALITNTDLSYQNSLATTGLAMGSGMCKRTIKCSVNEDQGLATGLTIAHETGHTLGMNHDGDGNNCANDRYMMAPNSGSSEWSPCSARALRNFINSGQGSCLNDAPSGSSTDLSHPRTKPGVIYSADDQCHLAMKDESSHFCEGTPRNINNECQELICSKPKTTMCSALGVPRMDGTECGKGIRGKWCIDGKCVAMGNSGPGPINGVWSAYESEWSECSRTCGGGVKLKRRKCNNPEPRFGGRDCVGDAFQSKLCNMQECQASQRRFKEEQCAATDSTPMRNRIYHWVPFDGTPGDEECKLKCRIQGGSTWMYRGPQSHDGTECTTNTDFGRCISGKCKSFGCDGHLESGVRFDHCSVCNGHADSCTRRQGTYNQGQEKRYVTFVRIDRGSTGIEITNGNQYCHMSIKANNRLLFSQNGKSSSGTYSGNGVVVKYRRSGPETITIMGPIPVPIEAQVWRNYGDGYLGTRPEINYSFYTSNGRRPNEDYRWRVTQGSCSRSCGTGVHLTTAECVHKRTNTVTGDYRCNIFNKPRESLSNCNTQDCPAEWSHGDWGSCSATCGDGVQQRQVNCVVIQGNQRRSVNNNRCNLNRKPLPTQQCNLGACPSAATCQDDGACAGRDASVCTGYPEWSQQHCKKLCNLCTDSGVDTCQDDGACAGRDTSVCTDYPEWSQQHCKKLCNLCTGHTGSSGDTCQDDGACAGRDTSVCTGYPEWSQQHCKKLCNHCGGRQTTTTVRPQSGTSDCRDTVDCSAYGSNVCTAYRDWAGTHCKKHCGFCTVHQVHTTPRPQSGTSDCRDTVDCNAYGSNVCTAYRDWAGTHCKKHCGFCTVHQVHTTPRPQSGSSDCKDTVDCNAYDSNVCTAYRDWAGTHCKKHCGFCTVTSNTCVDKHENCAGYGKGACQDYADWARENCQHYCGFCGTSTTHPPSCVDTNKDCASYGKDTCQNYKDWAKTNCQSFCNLCGARKKRSVLPEVLGQPVAPLPLPGTKGMVAPAPLPLDIKKNSKIPTPVVQSPENSPTLLNGVPPAEGGKTPVDVESPEMLAIENIPRESLMTNEMLPSAPIDQSPEEDQSLLQGIPPDEGGRISVDVAAPGLMGVIDGLKVPPPLKKNPVTDDGTFPTNSEQGVPLSENSQKKEEEKLLLEELDHLNKLKPKE